VSDPITRPEDDTNQDADAPEDSEGREEAVESPGEERIRLGTATYSPEDNKLRMYPFARLSKADYEVFKGAGFAWAPRQELFVASMWTPARAALLVRHCGEIDDENRSLLDRAEDRAERFEEYSERRGQEADAVRRQVESITEHIPLGQPILVGHHSERRARKDAKRIQNGINRAVKLWDTRDYWERRAKAAKQHAEYKQLPAVRYRRIKGIEADLRKGRKAVEQAQRFLTLWRKPDLTLEQAIAIAGFDGMRIVEKGQAWGTSTYDMLTRAEPKPLPEVVALSIRCHESRIAHQQPWIEHYEHRIAYERAMLDEDGGLVAEDVEMVAGGQVRVSDEWMAIIRVNKKDGRAVSVTTNRRFVPVRGIEEIEEYKPPTEEQAAQVKAATKLPPLANYPHEGAVEMTQAEWKRTYHDYKGTSEAGQGARSRYGRSQPEYAAPSPHGLHRVRSVVRQGRMCPVFITDAKLVQPPKPKEVPEVRATVPTPVTVSREAAPMAAAPVTATKPKGAESIEAMRQMLRTGGVKAVSVPQFFPTPMELANRMVEIAAPRIGERVLEPSAGNGNLLRALPGVVPFGTMKQTACDVVAVELNADLCNSLTHAGLAQRVIGGDFLQCTPQELGQFDVILMNPPFANGSDIKHIEHARQFLAPGGRLVAICADGPRQRERLSELGEYESLPEGSFASVGTQVNTAMVVIRDPSHT
jgi:phospholipid N-methyltransferase